MSPRSVLEKATSEDQLLATVTDALTLYRWRWVHQRRSDRAQTMGMNGLPDIIAVKRYRLLFIELKAEAGRLSPEQKLWHGALQGVAYGARVGDGPAVPETWLVKPSTLDGFLREIAR